jgi:hypothetical protein
MVIQPNLHSAPGVLPLISASPGVRPFAQNLRGMPKAIGRWRWAKAPCFTRKMVELNTKGPTG